MEIISKSRVIVERMLVNSYPGDPELVRLLTETDWLLDWHRDPKFSLIREIKIKDASTQE